MVTDFVQLGRLNAYLKDVPNKFPGLSEELFIKAALASIGTMPGDPAKLPLGAMIDESSVHIVFPGQGYVVVIWRAEI